MSYSYNVGMASRTDVFQTASAHITRRLFEGKPVDDKVWIVSVALVIVGFVAYQLLIASWLDTSKLASGSAKVAINDVLKFSTMFVVSRVLSGGAGWDSETPGMSQEDWVKDSGLFLASLVTYDLLFNDLVNEKTKEMDRTVKVVVNNAAKWMSVFAFHNFAKGGEFNKAWLMSSSGFVTGLIVYDLVIATYINKYIDAGTI